MCFLGSKWLCLCTLDSSDYCLWTSLEGRDLVLKRCSSWRGRQRETVFQEQSQQQGLLEWGPGQHILESTQVPKPLYTGGAWDDPHPSAWDMDGEAGSWIKTWHLSPLLQNCLPQLKWLWSQILFSLNQKKLDNTMRAECKSANNMFREFWLHLLSHHCSAPRLSHLLLWVVSFVTRALEKCKQVIGSVAASVCQAGPTLF